MAPTLQEAQRTERPKSTARESTLAGVVVVVFGVVEVVIVLVRVAVVEFVLAVVVAVVVADVLGVDAVAVVVVVVLLSRAAREAAFCASSLALAASRLAVMLSRAVTTLLQLVQITPNDTAASRATMEWFFILVLLLFRLGLVSAVGRRNRPERSLYYGHKVG